MTSYSPPANAEQPADPTLRRWFPLRRIIRQATIVFPESVVSNLDMLLDNGHICAIDQNLPDESNAETVCFHNDLVIPGLIDTHVHGAGGQDVMDGTPASLAELGRSLLCAGTTAYLATTITSPVDSLFSALGTVATKQAEPFTDGEAEILGVHLEGPLLSPSWHGAHNSDWFLPSVPGSDVALAEAVEKTYPGLLKIITYSPARPDTLPLAAFCRRHGIILSVGHTDADYETMRQAAAAGIRRVTHAFNAMPGIHHRRPGLLGEALLNPAVDIELIADGFHIHPAVLEMALRLKGPAAVTLVSDGTRAVGMPDGQYELGGQITSVESGVARLPNGTIAGSACSLLQGIRTVAQRLGRPLHEAVRYASLNPAVTLGLADRLGSIACGKEATFVRLDSHLAVRQVWQRGSPVGVAPPLLSDH